MKLEKTHIIIGAFILFWIILIGWGMLKTTLKLKAEKTTAGLSAAKPAPKPAAPSPIPQKPSAPAQKKSEEATRAVEVKETPAEERPILVRVLKAKPVDFEDILPVMGTIKGKTESELKFEVNGRVKKWALREGDKVKTGDLVACLDPKDLDLKVSYATSKLNSAQAAYNSLLKKLEVNKKLYEGGAILKTKLEEIELECESGKYQVETIRSELELAKNELKKTCIYAAKDGVIGPRKKEEGEFVTPQDKIGMLLETKDILVEVGVVERDIDKVKLGQKASVYVDAYPSVAFEGRVDSILPVVEGKSRTLTVKIKVPNPDGLLFPGMFSRAEILIVTIKGAFIVPSTCLVSGGKGVTLVPVIPQESLQTGEDETQTGVVELRRVKLGYLTSDYAQIAEGIKAEDLVVMEAQGELKDRVRVKIVGTEEISF